MFNTVSSYLCSIFELKESWCGPVLAANFTITWESSVRSTRMISLMNFQRWTYLTSPKEPQSQVSDKWLIKAFIKEVWWSMAWLKSQNIWSVKDTSMTSFGQVIQWPLRSIHSWVELYLNSSIPKLKMLRWKYILSKEIWG